jgi:signal transduction histidine kinase
MAGRQSNSQFARRRRGFLWQGLLILLPVLALAGVGLLSLRQDKSLATAQARERAQEVADSVIHQFLRRLYPLDDGNPTIHTNVGAIFPAVKDMDIVGLGGILNFTNPPLHFDPPDPQPLDLNSLTAEQRELWRSAHPIVCGETADLSAGTVVLQEFLASQPPWRFTMLAEYELGVLYLCQGQQPQAVAAFEHVLDGASNAVTEAGLPLLQLAQFHLLELWPLEKIMVGWTQAIDAAILRLPPQPPPQGRILIQHLHTEPPFDMHPWLNAAFWDGNGDYCLAPRLAEAADKIQLPLGNAYAPGEPLFRSGSYLAEWEKRARRLQLENQFRLAVRNATRAASGKLPRFVWYEDGDGHSRMAARLDMIFDAPEPHTLYDFMLIREPQVADLVRAAIADVPSVPRFLGVSVELGGRLGYRPAPPFTPAETLAVAHRAEQGVEFLKVNVHLLSPQMLYAGQRSRERWFGLLIAVSALAAVIGFFSARRAFLRQEQLSELKSNFVSSVSHELRAPLASVRLMAENLEHGKITDGAKQREYFRFIVQECRRLGALVENVLDFARIEQGRKEYDFEPTDIVALVAQTVKLMQPAAGEKQVTLLIDAARRSAELPLGSGRADLPVGQDAPQRVPTESRDSRESLPLGETPGADKEPRAEPELGAPLLDAPAIQQALINLLDNAIKHSPAGATVVVGLTPPTSPAATGNSHAPSYTLYVQDSGPGIPREEHEKIFQRFYRRGPELRRETQGVGIGLSIVKHIAEAHGGRVLVESEVGKGSRFAIELPCAQADEAKAQNKSQ